MIDTIRIFGWIAAFKIVSTAVQLYFGALITANSSSQDPWMDLKMTAHLGAIALTLRGLDALIDPAFQKLNPLRKLSDDDKAVVASETSVVTTSTASVQTEVKQTDRPVEIAKE